MNDFAAVTSAAKSRGVAEVTGFAMDAWGTGVGGAPARATEKTDAQASHIETAANAKALGKAILIDCGARGKCDIVENRPVIAMHQSNSGVPRRSQARRGATLYA